MSHVSALTILNCPPGKSGKKPGKPKITTPKPKRKKA